MTDNLAPDRTSAARYAGSDGKTYGVGDEIPRGVTLRRRDGAPFSRREIRGVMVQPSASAEGVIAAARAAGEDVDLLARKAVALGFARAGAAGPAADRVERFRQAVART